MTAEPVVANPPPEQTRPTVAPGPVESLNDPRAVQILATEHWSQLASRSLAYNEAFIRGGMFLTFLSMSFVGLALLAQAMGFNDQFLVVTAIVLAFDFVIGALTYVRIAGTAEDDLRSAHGMARIRNAYRTIAPPVVPYFTSPTYDDIPTVLLTYGSQSSSTIGSIAYGLSTSLGMIGLITAMVGGVLAAVLALLFDLGGELALLVGALSAIAMFAVMLWLTMRAIPRTWSKLEVRFPAPSAEPEPPATDASD